MNQISAPQIMLHL